MGVQPEKIVSRITRLYLKGYCNFTVLRDQKLKPIVGKSFNSIITHLSKIWKGE